MELDNEETLLAHVDYGGSVTAIVGRDTMVGYNFILKKARILV